jgi:hypothetical protein
MRNVWIRWGLVAGLFSLASACGNEVGIEGTVVGGDCAVNAECDIEAQCRTGEDWPAGYCARLCATDADCPEGSVCTDDGNFCLQSCETDDECRVDDRYACTTRLGRPVGAEVSVCALPES